MPTALLPWIIFNGFVLLMLALDLGVFHRKAHAIRTREALIWSGVWIALAMLFNGLVYLWRGPDAALEFFTGYLIEKSLSVDNIFVFVLIFSFFRVPEESQHRVLLWGVLGALVMRGGFIAAGAALLERFHWIIFIFGAFLIFTGIRMALQKEHGVQPDKNPLVKLLKRLLPVTTDYHGQRFLVRQGGVRTATPLLVTLVVVEFTDLIFAVDSIPAIFAVTRDTFIVYTSNVFAILGLRSLYFALAGVIDRFHLLKLGLAVVLVLVGLKMLLAETAFRIPTAVSLGGIALILGLAIAASLAWPKRER